MIDQVTFYGGAIERLLETLDVTLKATSPRLQYITQAIGEDPSFTLPDARTMRRGGPHFAIISDGSGAPEIFDADGNLLVTDFTAGVWFLLDNSTKAGVWQYRPRTLL